MESKSRLAVLWTTDNREAALKMVFMYTKNAKKQGWFDEVRLIIWGPSAKLLTEDEELKSYFADIIGVGVDVIACKACSDYFGTSEQLEELGVNVFYVGEEFTNILKSDYKVLTV